MNDVSAQATPTPTPAPRRFPQELPVGQLLGKELDNLIGWAVVKAILGSALIIGIIGAFVSCCYMIATVR